ncbi:hypothetical protein pb186bvf_014862 [Paramecium bursaria]
MIISFLTQLYINLSQKNKCNLINAKKYQIADIKMFILPQDKILNTYHLVIFLYYVDKEILMSNHESILLNKHIARQTSQSLWHYKNLIKTQIFHTDFLLLQLRNLYEFSLRDDLDLQGENVQCLQQHPNDSIVRNATLCYGIFGIYSENKEMQRLNKFFTTQLLNIQMDNIYFSSTSEEQYFTYWPGQYFNNKFIPHNRPWYIQNRQSNDSHVIKYSSPYLSVLGGIQVAKSINLGDRAIGVVDTDISIFQMNNNYQFIELQVIDNNGMYYFANEYEQGYENILYFQNTSITGFDESDLKEIINLKNGKPYNNSCPIYIKQSVCRRCIKKMDHNFFLTNISYPNLTIILRVDSQEFKNILQNLFKIFDSFAIVVIKSILTISGFMLLIIVLVLIATRYIIQKPIDQILQISIQYIRGSQSLPSNKYLLYQQSESQTMRNLQEAYFNLVNSQYTQSKISLEKEKIEKIEYPKHSMWLHIICSGQIQDFNQSIFKNCVFRLIIKEVFKRNSSL